VEKKPTLTGIRDPVERVLAICRNPKSETRREMERLGWSLGDVFRELSGEKPETSEVHTRFQGVFNGQTRAALDDQERAKLDFWAGVPERGAALRDRAIAALSANGEILQDNAEPTEAAEVHRQIDPETRALILAHNQIDLELYAHFAGLPRAPRRSRPRKTSARAGAVCVLGAPRSGTSLTARILNILGVDLGSEDELMEPRAENNRTGFWEHKGIADLNEEIFASLSAEPRPYLQGWRWPPTLEPGWEQDPRLDPLREAGAAMLATFGAGQGDWGWKDPRTSLTLPFWQQLVPEMRYVICVRHPLDVAASLAARDRMPTEESVALWTHYMDTALRATQEKPCLIVPYEGYFADWRVQANRLAHFLGKPEPNAEQRGAIKAHLDERLWHHRTPPRRPDETTDEAPPLAADAAELYERLGELATQA